MNHITNLFQIHNTETSDKEYYRPFKSQNHFQQKVVLKITGYLMYF